MEEVLYRKTLNGKRVIYQPVTPDAKEVCTINFTERQCLTVAGGLGITLLMIMEKFIPKHKRVAKKIKRVEDAVSDLYSGTGEQVDDEILDYIYSIWDKTMRELSK